MEETTSKTTSSMVPWETPELFQKVYKYLYSPEVTKKRWAVDELTVWESRCHPSVGTAIEASVVITRAMIQDVLMSNQTSLCQEKDIQLMYSMALIRFVNLSVELHQPDTKQATAQIAKGLGIPSWIVDLRHEASHSQIPSLPVLRMGAEAAMDYLDKAFWSVEASKEMKMVVKEPFNFRNINELLYLYQNKRYHIITSKESKDRISQEIEDMKEIINKLEIQISKNRKEVFELLLQDGVFIPAEEDLQCFLTHGEQKAFNYKSEDTYKRDLLASSDEDNDDDDDDSDHDMQMLPNVPILLKKLWYPIFKIMNEFHAIPEFIESLLLTQQWRYPIGQKILLSWVMQILLLHPEYPDAKKDLIRKIFTGGNAMFDWHRLLYAAIAYPCKYTAFILPIIFAHLNLRKEHVRSIMNLLAISQGLSENKNQDFPDDFPTFNLQDLKKYKHLQDSKRKEKKRGRKVESLFEEYSDAHDLKSVPIGYNFCIPKCDESRLEGSSEVESVENNEYVEKFLLCSDENDCEDYEMDVERTKLNICDEDIKIIRGMDNFLYKKRK